MQGYIMYLWEDTLIAVSAIDLSCLEEVVLVFFEVVF